MRFTSLATLLVVLGLALALPACGGSGQKFSIAAQDIHIDSTALPLTVTGQTVNHIIPTSGSCPGPYVMAVIQGQLPPGMFLDASTKAIRGVALQEGNFTFRIQIDATGCTPFATTHALFNWSITQGPVAIVLCDPDIIPFDANGNNVVDPEDYNPPNTVKWPGVDGLATTVYNAFAVFNFTVAGGVGPYTLDVIDDPADPNDGALPLGISIPPFSTSFVGSPQEVKPGGRTFLITLRATDSNNQTGVRKFQWKIDTPPIVVATTVLASGKCGTPYFESIQIVGGVPPFEFEQTGTLGINGTIVWQSPLAPIINGGALPVSASTGRTSPAGAGYPAVGGKVGSGNYPGAALVGPYTSITPEGVVLRENTGSFSGIPRRLGTFQFNIHVFSTLVPNEFGQHAWQQYTTVFANSEPPTPPNPAYSYGSLATWTLEGGVALLAAPPWSTIPEFEVGLPYNPDGGAAGLQFVAQGGVAKDGLIDAPHFTQVANNPAEVAGTYDWTIDWDADSVGALNPPPGITFVTTTGVLLASAPGSMVATGRTNISLTTTDQQLPTGNAHVLTGRAAYSVGPDKVIITESTTSNTATSMGASSSYFQLNDALMDVKVMRPFASGITVSALSNSDLSGTVVSTGINGQTTITTLVALLDDIDIIRISVNPTGYWEDTQGLNVNGARPGQHADRNQNYGYYNPQYDQSTSSTYIPQQPSVSAVALPNVAGVVANKGNGIYNDGGKMYAFQGSGKFGVFIVRRDSSITVPFTANSLGSLYNSFGDGTLLNSAPNKNSGLQVAQLAVSPDGRFGAMKLKRNNTEGFAGMLEGANLSAIVLFSLTGEKPFAGQMFTVIGTGSSGGSLTGGIYQYANSLCLTNDYLYYLCGNYSTTYASWKEHLIYRYQITGGAASGSLLPGAFPGRWTNTTGAITNMMQTPFQKFDDPMQVLQGQLIGFSFNGSSFNPVYGPGSTVMQSEMYMYNGWNAVENGLAPMPFRVSKDGQACAILAGIEPNTTNSTAVMNHDVWVDYQGTLRLLSTTQRHSPGGGGRGYQLAYGPNSYAHWGRYQGPTTRFEISDDASKVAVVVNRQNVAVNALSSAMWYNFRDDIVAWRTTGSPKWSSGITETQVTGTETATLPVFAGTHLWRFGALVFTKDNNGLVFWGGRNAQTTNVNTSQENQARFAGTLYSYDFTAASVRSILPTTDGGSDDGIKSYNNSTTQVDATNSWAPTASAYSMKAGRIRPFGGFVAKSRDFFYMIAGTPLSTSNQSMHQLVGVNVRSLNTANNINGKTDGTGFMVLGTTQRRGWLFGYNYLYGYYGLVDRTWGPTGTNGFSYQVMARNTGVVFTGSQYQANGPSLEPVSTGSSFYTGNTIAEYWGDYGQYGGQVEAFVPDIGGPIQRLNNSVLTGDTSIRAIHWLECNEDGNALAFVYDTSGNPRNYQGEVLMYQQLSWNFSTGTVTLRNPQAFSLASGGRVSDAIAHDTSGNRLYYAFSNSGNENGKLLTEMKYTKSLTAAPDTFATRTFATARNYNVLHSGR